MEHRRYEKALIRTFERMARLKAENKENGLPRQIIPEIR